MKKILLKLCNVLNTITYENDIDGWRTKEAINGLRSLIEKEFSAEKNSETKKNPEKNLPSIGYFM